MKPNRNNYASYNNYWYAMRTYRARLLGGTVVPPVDPVDPVDPELPEQIMITLETLVAASLSGTRTEAPDWLNEEWLWYGQAGSEINQVVVKVDNIPMSPDGYEVDFVRLKTRTTPAETFNTEGWTELWAFPQYAEEPIDAYIPFNDPMNFPYVGGQVPYKGTEPLSVDIYGLAEEDSMQYVILAESGVVTSSGDRSDAPEIRFNNDFYAEVYYKIIEEDPLPDYRILVSEPNEPETGPLGSLAFASVYAEDGVTPVRTANSIVFDPVEQKGYISATVNTLDLRVEGREINDAYYVLSVDPSVFEIEGFEPWHLDSTFFYSPVPIEDTASLDMDSLAMLGSTSGIYDEDKGGIVIYMKHMLEEHPSETLYLIGVSMYGPEDGTTVIPPSPSTIIASEYTLIDAPRVFRYQLPTAMSRTLTDTGELTDQRIGSAEVTIPAATETSFAITALPTSRLLEDFGSSLAGEGPWNIEARIRVNWENYILMPEGYSSGPDLVVPRLDRLGIEGDYVLPGLSSTSWLIPMWATEGIGSELMTDAIGTLYAPDPDDLPVSRSDDITSTLAELYRLSHPDTIASAEYPYTIPEEFPILLTSNYIYWAAPTNTEYDSLIYDANSFELEIIYRDARY